MKLKGERIVIRDIKYADSNDFYEYGKDPLVGPMAGWKPFPSKDVSDRVLTANLINREMFAITIEDKLIGTISLYNKPYRKYNKAKTIGFSLRSDYWNQGIMTEAVKLMINFVFKKTDVTGESSKTCKAIVIFSPFLGSGLLTNHFEPSL